MPKMKTKSGAKKRFRFTASGKVRMNPACRNHMLRRRPKDMKRQSRGTTIMKEVDARMVRSYMPYR